MFLKGFPLLAEIFLCSLAYVLYMGFKVVFIGNQFAGDDAIGPWLYSELKAHEKLKNFELVELDAPDLLSCEASHLIIVDAVCGNTEFGDVRVLHESELEEQKTMVSPHDFGVAESVKLLRILNPKLKISLIGITVPSPGQSSRMSQELRKRLPRIKEQVLLAILASEKK